MARAGIRIISKSGGWSINDQYHNVALISSGTAMFTATAFQGGRVYQFGKPTDAGAGPGLRIFNSIDRTIAFDSRFKYAKVVAALKGVLGQTGTYNYPAGKTYAYAVLARAWRNYSQYNNGSSGQYGQWLQQLTVTTPSATQLVIDSSTQQLSNDAGIGPPLPGGKTMANYAVLVLDVTGY